MTGPTGWRHQQSGADDRKKIVPLLYLYICVSTLKKYKTLLFCFYPILSNISTKLGFLKALLYGFTCTHDEREALQWTTADYRTYWDCISARCSWLAREEQWLQNTLTINHPERPVWYGHSQEECGGDGLMSAQHCWSYQQTAHSREMAKVYLQHQHRRLFLHLNRWFMNETSLF